MTSIQCPNCSCTVVALGETGVCDGCETGRASQPPKAKPVTEVQAFLAHEEEQEPFYQALHENRLSRPPLRQCLGDIVKARYRDSLSST